MSGAVNIGVFGKIPDRGDFISIGLPRSLTDSLEAWVKEGFTHANTQIGWEDEYFSSPIWQFSSAPKFWDARAWTGIIMPSVDSFGRKFPLIMAAPISVASRDWISLIIESAVQVLSVETFNFDAWRHSLLSLSANPVRQGMEYLTGPKRGGVFRVMSQYHDQIHLIEEDKLHPKIYCNMILCDLQSDEGVALL